MCRNLALAATALSLVLVLPALAKDKDKAPQTAVAAKPAAAAPPAPPRKASAQERLEADRLDPLARAAFWAREVDVDARDLDAGARLAASLRAIGRNEDAAGAAQKVLVIDPANKEALLELARAYLAGGQGFFAIEPLNKLQTQDARDWRIPSLLGVAYEQVSRDADAETAWRQALTLSPDNPAILSNLAMHYAAKGDSPQAEALLRKAVARPGATLQMRQNLALVLGLQGRFAEAEQLTRQDLPPELAEANMAYLHAAAGGGDARSWKALQGAQAATN